MSSQTKVKSPSKLAHVVLQAHNFTEMVDYYKKFLGAEASYENAIISFLRYDDEHHRLAIIGIPGTAAKDPNSAGMNHMAFTMIWRWPIASANNWGFCHLSALIMGPQQACTTLIPTETALRHKLTISIRLRRQMHTWHPRPLPRILSA